MTGHIFIEGEIDKAGEVNVKSVRNDIALYPQAKEFEVHVNSGGGDVYEGQAIGRIIDTELRSKGIKTVAKIGALCASIATDIAESCDWVEMGPRGDFMIHLPTGNLNGNAEDLRKGAAQLDRITSELINKYFPRVSRKGVTKDQLAKMITEETSMSPQQAFDYGFIDEITQPMKAVAKFDTKKFNMTDDKLNEETKGIFANFGKKLDEIISKVKNITFKNLAITLADGSTINTDATDVNAIVGSMVTDEQGQPLQPGTYETADGLALVVSEGGKVDSAEPITADKSNELEKLKQENAALKEQLAQKDQAVAQQKVAVETIAKQVAEFKNSADELKALKDQFEKLKNETFGDPNPAIDAPDKGGSKQKSDPMIDQMAASLGQAYITSRNFN